MQSRQFHIQFFLNYCRPFWRQYSPEVHVRKPSNMFSSSLTKIETCILCKYSLHVSSQILVLIRNTFFFFLFFFWKNVLQLFSCFCPSAEYFNSMLGNPWIEVCQVPHPSVVIYIIIIIFFKPVTALKSYSFVLVL